MKILKVLKRSAPISFRSLQHQRHVHRHNIAVIYRSEVACAGKKKRVFIEGVAGDAGAKSSMCLQIWLSASLHAERKAIAQVLWFQERKIGLSSKRRVKDKIHWLLRVGRTIWSKCDCVVYINIYREEGVKELMIRRAQVIVHAWLRINGRHLGTKSPCLKRCRRDKWPEKACKITWIQLNHSSMSGNKMARRNNGALDLKRSLKCENLVTFSNHMHFSTSWFFCAISTSASRYAQTPLIRGFPVTLRLLWENPSNHI